MNKPKSTTKTVTSQVRGRRAGFRVQAEFIYEGKDPNRVSHRKQEKELQKQKQLEAEQEANRLKAEAKRIEDKRRYEEWKEREYRRNQRSASNWQGCLITLATAIGILTVFLVSFLSL